MGAPSFSIPDWFSFENQGGNIATADLSGTGHLDLLVCMIDHPGPPALNRGLYRVGKKLDGTGAVTGGWGPWIDVPNWFSTQNQGCAIAAADLSGTGRLDLIVFIVDHPVPGPNRGIYQIGRALDADGNVTGGWSGWIDVANWFSWDNQGAAIAVTDALAPGRKDLLVFTVDHRVPGPNRGIYQVGANLGAGGVPTGGWGGWIDADWFSWENQGAGVALADLDGNGRPELLVFQIDNPVGLNAGQYRIGWNLDGAGRLQDGWGAWTGIPDWASFEDQGGGIALGPAGADGRRQLIAFHIDDPVGVNRGLYRMVPLTVDLDDAARNGVYRLLPYFSQVLPVHAAMLHTGKVLFFAGSGNSWVRADDGRFGDLTAEIYTSVVYDPRTGAFGHPPTMRNGGQVVDYFCCGHAWLPDGKLLVAGGTLVYDHHNARNDFQGRRDALTFDPGSETWSHEQPMAHGRWYPTLIALGDGRVLATTGQDENPVSAGNEAWEIFDPATGAWSVVARQKLPLYAHLFLLQDGSAFYAGGQMGGNLGIEPGIAKFSTGSAALKKVTGLQDPALRNQSSSVLLPPAQEQKALLIGGGAEDDDNVEKATNVVDLVDLSAATPAYTNAPTLNLRFRRMHLNAVLLPDRTVLATGGSGKREDASRVTFDCEIFDPAAGTWSVGAQSMVPRMYHSIALLLPDGRVLCAGGNPDKGSQANWLPPDRLEEMRIEIYSPPYLFKGKRPVIASAPAAAQYGKPLQVKTPGAASIRWISLIRPGVTTHSFNCEQRLVDVPFTVSGTDTLNGTLTGNPNLAPPGWYMLFITSAAGIPSTASWIHVSA